MYSVLLGTLEEERETALREVVRHRREKEIARRSGDWVNRDVHQALSAYHELMIRRLDEEIRRLEQDIARERRRQERQLITSALRRGHDRTGFIARLMGARA